jgi:hypothetical protein
MRACHASFRQKRKLMCNSPGASGRVFCRRVRLLPGEWGEGAGERWPGFRSLLDRMHAGERTCTWRRGLTLVRASSATTTGAPGGGWQRYSTEVQQLTRTRADVLGRGRTVTCTGRRGWTCCRQMACKRSAVRARLAPPGSEVNFRAQNDEPSCLRGKIRRKLAV